MLIPIRFKIAGLLWLMMTIAMMDRVNISITAPVIMQQAGWGEELFGIVFSAFLVGYTIFQTSAGIAADRWSGRAVLVIAMLGWSLFTGLTPLFVTSFYLFLGMRFLVGAFESATAPVMAGLNAKWFPQKEFATAQMVGIAGAMVGQLIAFPLATWILIHYSWPTVFYAFALPGVLWAAIWLYYSANTPREHASVTPAELEYIERERLAQSLGDGGKDRTLSFWMLLRSPGILVLALSYLFWTYGGWIMVAWLPTYLVKARHYSLQQMGWVGMLPTGAGAIGIVLSGVISDYLLRRGRSLRFSRQGFPAAAIALAAPLVAIAVSVESPHHAVAFLVIAQLINFWGQSGFWSTATVLYPGQVAAATAIMNTGGSLGGIFGPLVAGFLIAKTGNWALPFYTVAALDLLAASLLYWGVRIKLAQPSPQDMLAVGSGRALTSEMLCDESPSGQ
ncbi:MAG: MFS transporter [Acidobacteria bacterium]|nr:MFS transporter [Acidobacteriota bacterium]